MSENYHTTGRRSLIMQLMSAVGELLIDFSGFDQQTCDMRAELSKDGNVIAKERTVSILREGQSKRGIIYLPDNITVTEGLYQLRLEDGRAAEIIIRSCTRGVTLFDVEGEWH